MAADGTSIKNDIDNDLANKGYRGIRIATIITTLKKVVDWVTTVINTNQSTWYKAGTSNAPATNADDVYRTGKVIIGRSNLDTTGSALQTESFSLASIPWTGGTNVYTNATDWDTLVEVGTHCVGGNATWLSGGHGPGAQFANVFPYGTLIVNRSAAGVLAQTYLDNSSLFMYVRQKWQTGNWTPWACASRPADLMVNGVLSFPDVVANRKIALAGGSSANDNQFWGFGISASTLRYQIADTNGNHVFYAGTSPVTSTELMRIKGSGGVGINTSSIYSGLDVANKAGQSGVVSRFVGMNAEGALLQIEQSGIAIWRAGLLPNADAFIIQGWNNGAFPEYLRIDSTGNLTQQGNITAGTSGAPKDITAYGKIKSYFGSVLRAFAFGGATTTSGLTLKTTQYVSLEIDGTTYKLALVN